MSPAPTQHQQQQHCLTATIPAQAEQGCQVALPTAVLLPAALVKSRLGMCEG